MRALILNPERFFDPDPAIRRVANHLYEEAATLPLVCPHGHVPAALLSENEPFPEPTSLIIAPDHYILRMLFSRGISLENLGVPARDGTRVENDPKAIWRIFAENYRLFLGTPSRAWLDYEFYHVFGIRTVLSAASAMDIYDQIQEKLSDPSFLPRALFDRFNIEVLATTDGASDDLSHHRAIRESEWRGRVVPCFRPDVLFRIESTTWVREIHRLSEVVGYEVSSYELFVRALEDRRDFFRRMGATSTDHGVAEPFTNRLAANEATRLFERALRGDRRAGDQRVFEAHMLMEMARMSIDDGLVMQIHPGSFRDHNASLASRFGPDIGADIPVATEYTRNLRELLNEYGSDPRFTLVVFTLDESTYARELAPLAGHYPAMRIGPAWWFFDSIEGMTRYRELVTETAGFFNTAGFNDDTRAFLSIPARHDLSRRVDANYLARLVARHQIEEEDAHHLIRELSGDLARRTYRLDG